MKDNALIRKWVNWEQSEMIQWFTCKDLFVSEHGTISMGRSVFLFQKSCQNIKSFLVLAVFKNLLVPKMFTLHWSCLHRGAWDLGISGRGGGLSNLWTSRPIFWILNCRQAFATPISWTCSIVIALLQLWTALSWLRCNDFSLLRGRESTKNYRTISEPKENKCIRRLVFLHWKPVAFFYPKSFALCPCMFKSEGNISAVSRPDV